MLESHVRLLEFEKSTLIIDKELLIERCEALRKPSLTFSLGELDGE